MLYVYYGANVFETLADKKDSPQHKMLVARLYNANVKVNRLTEEFGYCFRSIRKWAEALQNGTAEEILEALEGRYLHRKYTHEVEGFASYEFKRVYPKNKHSYSKEIRESIKEVFGVEISSETLRPLFAKLKAGIEDSRDGLDKKKVY